jgi:nicotinate-nucleotide adenylyltransferase
LSRVGVFGGTFDPVHHGHLIMAEEAVARLRLDRILFMALNHPPHKRAPGLAAVEHRLAMLRLATRGNPRFEVSRLEADRGGISYTVNTLETLRGRMRGDLFFVMGQDSLEDFTRWRDPDRIVALARLVVVPRGPRRLSRVPARIGRRVLFLDPPRIEISSTEIRRRVRRGLPVRYWTPDSVLRYVTRHGLYGKRTRS